MVFKLDFDEIYEKYSKLVYGLAHERMQDIHIIEDVVQEVFLRLSKELHRHHFYSESHVKSWLLRATSNLCTDILRRKNMEQQYKEQLEKEFQHLGTEDTIEKMFEQKDVQDRMELMFHKLLGKNPRWYYVTMEYYYNQKTNRELAKEFELSNAGMAMLLFRIRKWIGKELLKQNPDLRLVYHKKSEELELQKQVKEEKC